MTVISIIGLIAVILGLFGFNELITNRVTQKVDEQINTIKDDIRLSKRELDMSIVEANAAKNRLENDISSLQEQRAKLVNEVNAFRLERDNIASILKEELCCSTS